MGRKKKKEKQTNIFSNLQEGTLQGVIAIVLFVLVIFLVLASLGAAGRVGNYSYKGLTFVLGLGYFLLPLIFLMLGISFLRSLKKNIALIQTIAGVFFFFSGMGIINLILPNQGGIIGKLISAPLIRLFDFYIALLVLAAVLIISILFIFDIALSIERIFFFKRFFKKNQGTENQLVVADNSSPAETVEEKVDGNRLEEYSPGPAVSEKTTPISGASGRRVAASFLILRPYTPPPLSLLEGDRGKPGVGDIKANANIIKRTLQNFGINVEMDEISIGPTVTRYALKPAEGVKLSRIVALQNDLALALAAHPLRVEAPIPGKSLVGIELPNSSKTTVGLGTLLSNSEFQNSDKPLLMSLGRGISGQSYFVNLSRMPHLLIAGATGSGKSVTIHALITSLLYRNSPENLKFIMIDPKRVELTLYNKIPHLLTPVITDAKKAILALKWAAKEMDRRYDILETEQVRDVESYHKNILEPELKKAIKKNGGNEKMPELPDTMPYIVIVIDELADIMSTYPRELESAIVRLAQMSRAVGIHLILSTQRPSVNIITGLIKANIPARIALQVSSQIDSRTILDSSGAEKLLGSGDMLYLSGEMSKPQRIQSAFISENEVKKVVGFLSDQYRDAPPQDIEFTSDRVKNSIFDAVLDNEDSGSDDDELYEEAREIVISAGKASTSYLQRKLRIGYARAARLVDMLEDRGIIAHADGSKPREVLEKYPENEYGEEQP